MNKITMSAIFILIFSFQQICPNESLPLAEPSAELSRLTLSDDRPVLTVYTDIQQVSTYLKHAGFKVVDDQANADIWWLQEHFKDYRYVT